MNTQFIHSATARHNAGLVRVGGLNPLGHNGALPSGPLFTLKELVPMVHSVRVKGLRGPKGLLDLPLEMIYAAAQYLPEPDVAHLMATCSTLRTAFAFDYAVMLGILQVLPAVEGKTRGVSTYSIHLRPKTSPVALSILPTVLSRNPDDWRLSCYLIDVIQFPHLICDLLSEFPNLAALTIKYSKWCIPERVPLDERVPLSLRAVLHSTGASCKTMHFFLDEDAIHHPISFVFSEHKALSESIRSRPLPFQDVVLPMPVLKALSHPEVGVAVDTLLSGSLEGLTISGVESSADISFLSSKIPNKTKRSLKQLSLKTRNAKYLRIPTTFLHTFTALRKFEYSHRACDWPTPLPTLSVSGSSSLVGVSLSPGFSEVLIHEGAKLEAIRVDPCTGAPPSYVSGYCDVVSQQLSSLGAFKASDVRPMLLELCLPYGLADHIVDFTHGHHGRLYAARHRSRPICTCFARHSTWKPQQLSFIKKLDVYCPAFRAPPKYFYAAFMPYILQSFPNIVSLRIMGEIKGGYALNTNFNTSALAAYVRHSPSLSTIQVGETIYTPAGC